MPGRQFYEGMYSYEGSHNYQETAVCYVRHSSNCPSSCPITNVLNKLFFLEKNTEEMLGITLGLMMHFKVIKKNKQEQA